MEHRHLDYPADTPVTELGTAALDDLLERGDLESWRPLADAIRAEPHGRLADTVLHIIEAHPMYGTSPLWRTWIERLRRQSAPDAVSLAELRRKRGLTQGEVGRRLGISQSDVSKLERRNDLRLSTLRSYVAALGGRVNITAIFEEEAEGITIR